MKKVVFFILAIFLILLYSAIDIILLIYHEPYEDEAQAWLIKKWQIL